MKKRKKKEEEYNHKKVALTDRLKLPKDLMLGAAVITVTGQCEAYIENYRGILEYTENKIRLQTKTCCVEIEGKKLYIGYYTNDEMKITGFITGISYR